MQPSATTSFRLLAVLSILGRQSCSASCLGIGAIRGSGEDLSGQHHFDAAKSLPGTFLVLDQRESHMAVAVFAETDAGTDGDFGVGQQQLAELERAEAT